MNCDKCRDLITPLIHGLLKPEHKQSVMEHLKQCPDCLSEFKQTKTLHDRLTGNGHALGQKNLETTVWERITREKAAQPGARVQGVPLSNRGQDARDTIEASRKATESLNVRRSLMRSPISRFAAAAVMIIAAGLAAYFFLFGPATTNLEAVLAKIKTVAAYAYKMNMDMRGIPGMEMTGMDSMTLDSDVLMAPELGMKVISRTGDKVVAETYISMEDGVALSVMHDQKKYMTMTFNDELLEQMQKQNNDPKAMLEEFIKHEYTDIGESTIDGVTVQGFECRDPNIVQNMLGDTVARIWVNPKTELVVRYELEAFSEGKQTIDLVLEDFEWDVQVDPSEFEAKLPEGYEEMANVEVKVNEESMVEALSYFKEMTGRYPREMNPMSFVKELQDGVVSKFKNSKDMGEEKEQDLMQDTMNLTMSFTFFGTLKAQGKDPAYYGDTVTPEFPDAVLMRWLGDDDKYIIIFGNLTVGRATAEELKELEAAPLNTKPEAMLLFPADGIIGVDVNDVVLSWLPGAYVTDHKVYFGTAPDGLELLAEVTDDTNAPAPILEHGQTYYWRVDEVQPDGSIASGDVWSFSPGELVAHYTFDETAGTVAADSGPEPAAGKLSGDPAWTTGRVGGALELDGDGDYVILGSGDTSKFEITERITVAAWIKVSAFDRNWQTIIAKGNKAWRLQKEFDKNNLEFVCSGTEVLANVSATVHGVTEVNDGNWHHVAGTYDGANLTLYVDGEVDGSAPARGRISPNTGFPVFVGANSERTDEKWSLREFNGLIDDVRVYSYALSEAEIEALAK